MVEHGRAGRGGAGGGAGGEGEVASGRRRGWAPSRACGCGVATMPPQQ
jgi:hypothetical protein